MSILVTGSAGHIGTHTLVEISSAGSEVIVLDNLCNSSAVGLERVEAITGKPVTFVQGDVRDVALSKEHFTDHSITSVVHIVGLKAVSESVTQQLKYYDNNIFGSLVIGCYGRGRRV